MQILKSHNKADFIGIISSCICLVHCIVMPIIFLTHSAIHSTNYLDYIFLIVSFHAVFQATKYSNSKIIIVILWASFILFMIGILGGEENLKIHIIGMIGSVGQTIGHIFNINHCKKCK